MFPIKEVLGCDISKWQDNNVTPEKMNMQQAKDNGIEFIFIKASQGFYKDPDFYDNWENAKKAGIPRGAYHFADKNWGTAKQQAENFWNTIKFDEGELPPVLDFEARENIGLSFIKYFLEYIEERSKQTPAFYTGEDFWNRLTGSSYANWILKYPLWMAYPDLKLQSPVRRIPTNLMDEPPVPNVWKSNNVPPLFWQFTWVGDGKYYGAESKGFDLNVFNGDLMDFYDFIKVGEIQPPQPSEDYVEVIASSFLRFRPEPVYNPNIRTLIVERGEVLQIAGATIYEPISGITWLPVFTPSKYSGNFIGYISANPKYVKYL